jgi:hypothetical protein
MRKIAMAILAALPIAAAAATWQGAPLVDQNCVEKVKAAPDKHTTTCLIQCAKSGYGILENGKWLKFDSAGNEKALEALKATKKKDHIRVDVTGELAGDSIHVATLSIPE